MKENFTAGPWVCHKYPKQGGGYAFSIRVKNCPGITIANLSPGTTSDRIEAVCEANAALMAAAPSLLSELRMFVIQCPCGNHSHVITTNKCCQKCASAVAAIAVAETGGAA